MIYAHGYRTRPVTIDGDHMRPVCARVCDRDIEDTRHASVSLRRYSAVDESQERITQGQRGERMRFSDVRYLLSPVPLSVCRLSVTLVRPTQAVEIFGNISTAFGILAIR